MQVYILDKDPIAAADKLLDFPKRAAACNMREGAQILSTCLILMGRTPLRKLDGTYYKLNHPNHPLVKWFLKDKRRLVWLYDHLCILAAIRYDNKLPALQEVRFDADTDDIQGPFDPLDEVPFFPAKEYDGPRDAAAYLEWKYGGG